MKFMSQAKNRPRGVKSLRRGQLTPVIQDATTAWRPLYLARPFTRIERS